jgi:P-type E1-E2 ATPase
MHLATQTQWLGSIYLSDQLRPEAKATVDKLKQQGLRVGILSGDHSAVVNDVSHRLGIQGQGGCTPSSKAAFIQSRPCKTVFVGDGLNDAPALAAAAVGIASAGSSHLAAQTAPVSLREPSSLQAVPQLLALAYQARQRMVHTLTWGLVYNSLAIPIAWSGLLTPTLGAIAMTLSALSVVTSALLPWPPKLFETFEEMES